MTVRRLVLSVCALALCLPACTQVTVVSAEDQVRVSRSFGLLTVDFEDVPADAYVVSSRGIGLVQTPTDTAIGYFDGQVALLGRDCRAVFWIEPGQALPEDVLDALSAIPDACRISPGDDDENLLTLPGEEP